MGRRRETFKCLRMIVILKILKIRVKLYRKERKNLSARERHTLIRLGMI